MNRFHEPLNRNRNLQIPRIPIHHVKERSYKVLCFIIYNMHYANFKRPKISIEVWKYA